MSELASDVFIGAQVKSSFDLSNSYITAPLGVITVGRAIQIQLNKANSN